MTDKTTCSPKCRVTDREIDTETDREIDTETDKEEDE